MHRDMLWVITDPLHPASALVWAHEENGPRHCDMGWKPGLPKGVIIGQTVIVTDGPARFGWVIREMAQLEGGVMLPGARQTRAEARTMPAEMVFVDRARTVIDRMIDHGYSQHQRACRLGDRVLRLVARRLRIAAADMRWQDQQLQGDDRAA